MLLFSLTSHFDFEFSNVYPPTHMLNKTTFISKTEKRHVPIIWISKCSSAHALFNISHFKKKIMARDLSKFVKQFHAIAIIMFWRQIENYSKFRKRISVARFWLADFMKIWNLFLFLVTNFRRHDNDYWFSKFFAPKEAKIWVIIFFFTIPHDSNWNVSQ